MATTISLISGALRLLGVISEGETPSAAQADDAMSALNLLLDSWGITALARADQEQILTWPAGNATRTIGPTGNIVGVAPIKLSPAPYLKINGTDYPLEITSREEYNAIPDKTEQSTIPTLIVINETSPNTTMTMWPVPSSNVELHVWSSLAFAQATSLTAELSLPAGYAKAIKYNLACEVAPEYGLIAPAPVQREAMNQVRIIGRSNYRREDHLLSLPVGLAKQKSNIITG